ncbi:hypothetical protein B1774_06380 [Dehalococcoides mccartyi]|uniref:efflux RND transporter permease subunit n=1 Tax=Dehalococcoides mccartyi TaxID=61435 RepID=UPI00098F9E33|nr:efflux RND transporter permease subunit [Dehalococcoides mccartyi]AQU03691.1 hypothetical protein B1773_06730 [Dehalococcoides mccartyi]AQU04991.1 hypothetical protein B1774_06380 [Dehalococcoides mccartyi]
MKTLLIFPPQWIPYQPYLSLPSLTAYLKANGIDTIQYDFNIDAYNTFFSAGYLRSLKTTLTAEFKRLDSSQTLSPVEQQYYNDLFMAGASLERVADEIPQAKAVFHDNTLYHNPAVLAQARETLNQAMAIISTAHFPTRLDLSSFETGAYQRSYEDILNSTADNEQNPYLKLCRQKLLPLVAECRPDIIGISVAGDSQLIPALTLARQLKAANPKVHIVIGGYIISLLSDVITRHEGLFKLFFDSAVVSEGEQPLLELVKCLESGRSLSEVPNLIYFDGCIRVNQTRPSLKIDSLPTPCFEGLNLGDYLSPEPVLPLLASRGCYWGKCAFCSHNEAYGWHYQKRQAVKIAEDMQSLSTKYQVDKFAFADEGLSPSLAGKLSDELIKRDIQVNCSVNVRLEPGFTPELCLKMRKAGFRVLFLGLESGCNRILEHMEKGTTKEIAAQVCRNIYQADIWNHLYVFLGFPTESAAEAGETIAINISLPSTADVNDTSALTAKVEAILGANPAVRSYSAIIGTSATSMAGIMSASEGGGGANTATITVYLTEGADLQTELSNITVASQAISTEGVIQVSSGSGDSMGGSISSSSINLSIQGQNQEEIAAITAQLLEMLEGVDGLTELKSDLTTVVPVLNIEVDPAKVAASGISAAQLAQLQQEFVLLMNGGALPGTTVTLESGSYPVYFKGIAERLTDAEQAKSLKIGFPVAITLSDIANVGIAEVASHISHTDTMLSATITGLITDANVGAVNMAVQEQVDALPAHPGVEVVTAGIAEQMGDTFTQMGIAILVAIAIVFLIVILMMRSIRNPLLIMLSIPLAFIGSMLALVITGYTLGVSALMGLLMLVGIVLTNAIVLVSMVEQQRKRGLSVKDALIEGGKIRLRPIVMTALTTILAMIPMALSVSSGTVLSAELAVVVIGGMVSSTFLTLFVIPAVYSMVYRGK